MLSHINNPPANTQPASTSLVPVFGFNRSLSGLRQAHAEGGAAGARAALPIVPFLCVCELLIYVISLLCVALCPK